MSRLGGGYVKVHRAVLTIAMTEEFEVVDVTADVETAILEAGVTEGFVIVYSLHTTCSIMVQSLESGVMGKLAATLRRLVPAGDYYAHDDLDIRTENLVPNEPANAHAHLRQIIGGGVSQCIPVFDGRPQVGERQRIVAVEFDSGRARRIVIHVCGV